MECFALWGGKFLANVSVEADAEWSSVRTRWEASSIYKHVLRAF
jgi:hypothetical protein